MTLVSQAMGLWLRSVCQSLEELELELNGSALALMAGRLEGADLRARGVVYQQLCLQEVQLSSDPIALNMAALLKGRPLQLRQRFRIRGSVGFTESGLNRCLATELLRPFSNQLANHFLRDAELASYGLGSNSLELTGTSGGRRSVSLSAEAGELLVRGESSQIAVPMDPVISIERVSITPELLLLEGQSLVSAAGEGQG
jgi:hypothetical protein